MNAGTKFAIGAVLIVGSVGYLMASGVKQTGQYYFTPSELSQKIAVDRSFYNVGMKVGRSEERRVGKECRSQWSADQYKKKGKWNGCSWSRKELDWTSTALATLS